MIKKWLNNPVVVGILVLLAAAFVFRDMINLDFGGDEAAAPTTALVKPASVVAPVAIVSKPVVLAAKKGRKSQGVASKPGATNWAAVAALPLAARDPFEKVSRQFKSSQAKPVVVIAKAAKALPTVDPEAPPSILLTAVVSGADGRYASLNGEMKQVGEYVGGWKVTAMSNDRVQLRGKLGLLTLGMDGSSRLGGKLLPKRVVEKPAAPLQSQPSEDEPSHATGGVSSAIRSPADLNMYQKLYDALIAGGAVPKVPVVPAP
ncbi:MAG: hypothetical protein R8J84_05980 [Mariprofundales bacterium]